MAPTTNGDIIPTTISYRIMDAFNQDASKIAGLWAYMKREGYAEQARLARDSQRHGIVSQAAAKYFNAPSKNMKAEAAARTFNSGLKGRVKGKGKEAEVKGKGKGKGKPAAKLTGHDFTRAIIPNQELLQFEEDVPAHRLTPQDKFCR